MIVYNAEPYGYSEKAVSLWEEKGCTYRAGSWEEIEKTDSFPVEEILIVRLRRNVDKAILSKFPKLKKLISATTGLDHIDKKAVEERGIEIVSLRGKDAFLRTIPSTAEHTWALLMALIRNVPAANEDVKSGTWNRDAFRGYQLKDKVLGIIGYGRTGQRVARYADAFDMKVKFFDPYVQEENNGHQKVLTLEKLLSASDILTLHVHLNDETRHLINAKNIQHIKKGAWLINTSRGAVWEEATIAGAIQNNHLSGIATDVLTTELSHIKKSPLWQTQKHHSNVIITSHIGGATWDAMWVCEEFLVQNIVIIRSCSLSAEQLYLPEKPQK